MKNQYKEMQSALMKEYNDTFPDFKSGKKIILNLMAVIVFLRVANSFFQILYCTMNDIPLSPLNIFTLIFQVVVLLFYTFFINRGIKPFIYLILFGGVVSLLIAYRNNVFAYLTSNDNFFNFINYIFLAGILSQIIIALFLLINTKTKGYFEIIKKLKKEVSDSIKNNNQPS